VLNVEAKQALLKLVRAGRLAREQVAGRYVYFSPGPAERRPQQAARSVYDAEASRLSLGPGLRVLPDELRAAIVLFYSLLDERQRRLCAGSEAMKFGSSLRSKSFKGQVNEVLCKVIVHNICVLISAMHESQIDQSTLGHGGLPVVGVGQGHRCLLRTARSQRTGQAVWPWIFVVTKSPDRDTWSLQSTE
jgi:hypothetical protein